MFSSTLFHNVAMDLSSNMDDVDSLFSFPVQRTMSEEVFLQLKQPTTVRPNNTLLSGIQTTHRSKRDSTDFLFANTPLVPEDDEFLQSMTDGFLSEKEAISTSGPSTAPAVQETDSFMVEAAPWENQFNTTAMPSLSLNLDISSMMNTLQHSDSMFGPSKSGYAASSANDPAATFFSPRTQDLNATFKITPRIPVISAQWGTHSPMLSETSSSVPASPCTYNHPSASPELTSISTCVGLCVKKNTIEPQKIERIVYGGANTASTKANCATNGPVPVRRASVSINPHVELPKQTTVISQFKEPSVSPRQHHSTMPITLISPRATPTPSEAASCTSPQPAQTGETVMILDNCFQSVHQFYNHKGTSTKEPTKTRERSRSLSAVTPAAKQGANAASFILIPKSRGIHKRKKRTATLSPPQPEGAGMQFDFKLVNQNQGF